MPNMHASQRRAVAHCPQQQHEAKRVKGAGSETDRPERCTFSCCVPILSLPFLGTETSILLATIVMLEVTRQTLASPSCIVTAATSYPQPCHNSATTARPRDRQQPPAVRIEFTKENSGGGNRSLTRKLSQLA